MGNHGGTMGDPCAGAIKTHKSIMDISRESHRLFTNGLPMEVPCADTIPVGGLWGTRSRLVGQSFNPTGAAWADHGLTMDIPRECHVPTLLYDPIMGILMKIPFNSHGPAPHTRGGGMGRSMGLPTLCYGRACLIPGTSTCWPHNLVGHIY